MSRQGRLTLLIWLALIAIAAWQAARTPIRTDLSVFLPRAPAMEQQILIEQLRAGALARLVLVGIEGGTAEERAQASRALAAALRADAQFTQVANGDGQSLQADRAFVFKQRYLLSPTVDAARFSVDGPARGDQRDDRRRRVARRACSRRRCCRAIRPAKRCS